MTKDEKSYLVFFLNRSFEKIDNTYDDNFLQK